MCGPKRALGSSQKRAELDWGGGVGDWGSLTWEVGRSRVVCVVLLLVLKIIYAWGKVIFYCSKSNFEG